MSARALAARGPAEKRKGRTRRRPPFSSLDVCHPRKSGRAFAGADLKVGPTALLDGFDSVRADGFLRLDEVLHLAIELELVV